MSGMDFQSAMETFAEAWVAANTGQQTQALALTLPKTQNQMKKENSLSPKNQNNEQHEELISQIDSKKCCNEMSGNHEILNQQNLTPNSTLSTTPKLTISGNENGLIGSGINTEQILPSPLLDRKEFDFSKVNAKSLPLHCVVESVSSLQTSLTLDARNPWKRRPNIETDSYVIVASSTPWSDIVGTALQRLGYSLDLASTARGSLIIKNWKPIPLENISDNPVVPVCDILGELISVVTLRIVILRTKPTILAEVKDKLLKLLVLQSHAVLRSTGCPLDEVTLSHICRGTYQNSIPYPGDISDEIRRKFDQWWNNQLSPHSPITPKLLPFLTPQPGELEFSSNHPLHNTRENLLDNHHGMIVHPALQTIHSQYPNQKTRMRTSFDPEMELPKLQKWFNENPHPSRQQIQSYVIQLNSLDSRRGRKPLDINNVVYWFKNARAAQKRAEMRGQGLSNGYLNNSQNNLMMSHNDYSIKSPPSLPSEDVDNLSQHSDDMDSSQPSSPQLPLSLTMHERHRTIEDIQDSDIKEENEINNRITERNNNNPDNLQNGEERSSDDTSNNQNYINENHNYDQHLTSPKNSIKSDDLDMDDNDISTLDEFRSPSPDPRRDLKFPIVPNSMFSHSIMYMSHYMPGMGQQSHSHHQHHHYQSSSSLNSSPLSNSGLNLSSLSSEERRKRNRTFIDPVTEVPKLEQWFALNTHPSHNLILKYTEDLNRMPYRQKFPRLESKNVQFWFKNRRAKCKRLKMSLYDVPHLQGIGQFPKTERE